MFGNLAKKLAPQVQKALQNPSESFNKIGKVPSTILQKVGNAVNKRGFSEGGSTMSAAEKQAREEMAERKMQDAN